MNMIKKLRARNAIQLPETFIAATHAREGTELSVYFGQRFNILVITSKDVNLSNDDIRRINLLTSGTEKGE